MYQPKACTIFLNRACPRHCPYCASVDMERDKKRMHVDNWIECFEVLRDVGVEFFLILGTEPLLLGRDLIKLVKYWKEEDLEYGLYSTSPMPLFALQIPTLLSVGLRNWSSGIDFVPEVYEEVKYSISQKAKRLVESQKGELVKKAEDALAGFKYMKGRVDELHALITISRMNVEFVPEMIQHITDKFDNTIHIGLNYVEYSNEPEMDFATPKDNSGFFFEKSDYALLQEMVDKLQSLSQRANLRTQIPFDYLENYDWAINLDWKCKLNSMAMSIDCDGSIRLCGYKTLNYSEVLHYWDLKERPNYTLQVLENAHKNCSGCYWSYPYVLEHKGAQILNYRSKLWKKRDEVKR